LLRSKDLRLAVALASALAARRGFYGLADALALARGLLERYWATLYPQLEPDDPTDATMRVNALAGLCEPRLLSTLRGAPLVVSRSFGSLAWRDLGRTEGGAPADPAAIEGAFNEAAQDDLVALVASIRMTLSHVQALEEAFAPVSRGPDFAPLVQMLREIRETLEPRIHVEHPATGDGEAGAEPGAPPAAGPATAFRGEVRSRDDVLRAIDAICKYYATHEPSSPLPLLLRRCKRLVTATFVEILQEMVPDALPQVRVIAGKTEE
jgi:type VI secretion system protein ImpA